MRERVAFCGGTLDAGRGDAGSACTPGYPWPGAGITIRVISDAKVMSHVARVLLKVNLTGRVQAVIFLAYGTSPVMSGETAPWTSLP